MKIFRLLVAFTLIGFALSQRAQGVVPPPPGGYPNFTTAAGDHALQALTLGLGNTALGTFSLFSVTTGNFNTAVGAGSLDLNQADSNTATGAAALLFNTTGTENTANGTAALEFNETGTQNTANGAFALFNNTTGGANTASGFQALLHNTVGGSNTANGLNALGANTTGDANTANGVLALGSNTVGGNNTANGALALLNNPTGINNTAIGAGAGSSITVGTNNICIGHDVSGVATETFTIRIGDNFPAGPADSACFIGGIQNQNVNPATAVAVQIDTSGKLGTLVSSRRFKHSIKPMDKSSEAILALKPVTFHYKSDAKNTPCFGLIAEEVAAVDPDLVVHDEKGEILTVRYEAVNAMLLNEFLKEHKKTEKLEATVANLIATVKEQAAQIQKVSAQLEASKLAPQVAENNK